MKILQLTAENVKKIKVVEITPTGGLVQITGRNGSGKTSVLDSIWWALGGKDGIQDKPIRDGEQKARVRLDLGEIVVERKFTQAGTTLTVENGEGARYPSPQAMLDTLIGELSFDPLAFAKMKARDQFDELKRVAKVEIDIEKLEAQNRGDTDKRRDKNREAKECRVRADAIKIQFPEMTELVDTNSLVQKVEDAGKANANVRAEQIRRQQQFLLALQRELQQEHRQRDLFFL